MREIKGRTNSTLNNVDANNTAAHPGGRLREQPLGHGVQQQLDAVPPGTQGRRMPCAWRGRQATKTQLHLYLCEGDCGFTSNSNSPRDRHKCQGSWAWTTLLNRKKISGSERSWAAKLHRAIQRTCRMLITRRCRLGVPVPLLQYTRETHAVIGARRCNVAWMLFPSSKHVQVCSMAGHTTGSPAACPAG